MRLSAFNLYIEHHPGAHHPEPGSVLVHNTFTGGFVTLLDDELRILRRADAGEPLSADELAGIDPDYLDPSVGILVEDRPSEERAYRAWYESQRARQGRLSAIVSTTFACNLDCTYCCQSDVLDGTTMATATSASTAAWLVERARSTGATELHLDFVGGEPLLHPPRIEHLLAEIRRASDLRITFGVITNGVFLTRALVERWLPLGLVAAQVTLDGDETTHSITRRSKKGGEDSFGVIFQNLVDVMHLVRVNVNGNYQTDTAHGFVPLIAKLASVGFPRGGHLHFTPALAALGAPTESASGACTWSGSSPEIMIALSDEALRAGFDPGDGMMLGPCGFHLRNNFAIDPEGHIYKCPGFLGHPEWAIGHVTSGLGPRYEALVGHDVQSACGDCGHRPNCAGGCVAATWLKSGTVEGVNCERDFFESQQDALVTRKYALAVADSTAEAVSMFRPIAPPKPASPVRRVGGSVQLRVLAA